MAKEIVWRNKASYEFDAIIEYLTNEWGENVAANFVVRAYQIIDTLSNFPEMGSDGRC